jgi:hypothetical protein
MERAGVSAVSRSSWTEPSAANSAAPSPATIAAAAGGYTVTKASKVASVSRKYAAASLSPCWSASGSVSACVRYESTAGRLSYMKRSRYDSRLRRREGGAAGPAAWSVASG